MKLLLTLLLAATLAPAAQQQAAAEERDLNRALSEAGTSPVEFIRALEKHLEKYPNTSRRSDLERAVVKAAIDSKDEKRVIQYGERVLARESDDVKILDRVTRALLSSDDKESAQKALKYAQRYAEVVGAMRKESTPGKMSRAEWLSEVDRGVARALVLQARATGNLGNPQEAAALAQRSYEALPTAEGAREIARWLARSGRKQEAIVHHADAFTISDGRATDADRAIDRTRMGELYRELHGSEKGLGDLVLEAYDRTTALLAARRMRMREDDPNAQLTSLLDFTLSGLKGDQLKLTDLKGKTIVFDFWATWCGPCRVQHPLYAEVKRNFKDRPEVVFLSVNTDEERSLVEPFLRENKWEQKVYFEDGLARLLQISSIPTTIIVNRRGEVVSRMNGFLPDRFVGMLSERIQDALKN